MSKERRLGRGLEALLGQLPGWTSPTGAPRPATGPMATDAPGLDVAPQGIEGASAAEPPATGQFEPQPASPAYMPPPAMHDFGPLPPEAAPAPPADESGSPARLVAIELIEPNPHQPRQDFNPQEIQQLADSITTHGLLQPVVVRRVQDHYQLVAGERRLRAAREAGWVDVPVVVVDADDRKTAELAIVENLQRKDLNALEKAASFQRYIEQYGCTQEDLAGRLKIDRSTIANLIRLLELPEPVQDAIRSGRLTQGHARALLPLGEEREQLAFADRIQKEGLSVRRTEELVQETIASTDRGPQGVIGRDGKKSKIRRGQSEHLASLEQEFRTALGVRVKITHDAKGRGKLVVPFGSHEEFERLRQHICGTSHPASQGQVG